jgi:hypothetical protein
VRSAELRHALRLAAAALAALAMFGATACRRHAAPPAPRGLHGLRRPAPLSVEAPPLTNRACELLTKSDAEDLLGGALATPVTSIVQDIGVVTSRCGYIAKGGSTVKVVTLLAKTWQNPADARYAFEHAHALSQSVSGQAPETIAGLGNRAYWAGGTASQLNVLSGATWMVFSGTAGPGVDPLPQDKAAAEKALSRDRS